MSNKRWSLFERSLAVPTEDLEFTLAGIGPLPWSPFWLNPRRLRGSDFLMRWSQGVWSEERFIGAINSTAKYVARPYGPSSVAPSGDIRAHELYFERLEHAGLGTIKRPDLLVFRARDARAVDSIIDAAGGTSELPFVPETELRNLLEYAVIGVECENSLWVAEKMPAFGEELRPMRRLQGRPGLPKRAVLPTVIVKEEDREPLSRWEDSHGTPIHIWHAFFDRAYGLSFGRAQELIESGLIEPKKQVFQAPGGSTTAKITYFIYYQYAYDLGVATTTPTLVVTSTTQAVCLDQMPRGRHPGSHPPHTAWLAVFTSSVTRTDGPRCGRGRGDRALTPSGDRPDTVSARRLRHGLSWDRDGGQFVLLAHPTAGRGGRDSSGVVAPGGWQDPGCSWGRFGSGGLETLGGSGTPHTPPLPGRSATGRPAATSKGIHPARGAGRTQPAGAASNSASLVPHGASHATTVTFFIFGSPQLSLRAEPGGSGPPDLFLVRLSASSCRRFCRRSLASPERARNDPELTTRRKILRRRGHQSGATQSRAPSDPGQLGGGTREWRHRPRGDTVVSMNTLGLGGITPFGRMMALCSLPRSKPGSR